MKYFLKPWKLGRWFYQVVKFGIVQYMIIKILTALLAVILEAFCVYCEGEFNWECGDKHELEVDFKRFWEEFRSSNSEKLLSKLRVFRADETPLEVPPREVINFGDQAVVEFMADLVAKRDTKAAPPKNEKGFWFRICSICWPFRTANTDNKMCVCVCFYASSITL
ncbi:hypothetical protein ES288_D06G079700v1 [Gossypium darwinii]|uniref:Uncharacterized protein n=1 Tax=Gossypium darwinii TaxID=34276 RepID=A0A5D2C7G1_GOSDA|nr:hypothetical protein ES288_D06G079700v1 [Gossypium darwinii]